MISDPSFRTLGPEDHDAWRDIRLEMLAGHPDAFLGTLAEERAKPEAERRAQLAAGRIIGAFLCGKLAGTLALLPERHAATSHRASIGAFYVRPDHRRSGVARALIAEAEARARAVGILQLELNVAEGNCPARAVYEAAGFAVEGRLPRAVRLGGIFIDDVFYVRHLDS